VGGTLYNVEFVDGTCAALFNGCNLPTDFTFTTQTDDIAASAALLNSVFISGFESHPEKIHGCSWIVECFTLTPYRYNSYFNEVNFSYVNISSIFIDDVGLGYMPQNFDSANSVFCNFASWSQSIQSVPEPSSFLLLASGLVGIAGYRWRQRHQAGVQVG